MPGRLRWYLQATKTGDLQENNGNLKMAKQTYKTAVYGDDLSPVFQVGFNHNGTSLLGADTSLVLQVQSVLCASNSTQ